MQTERLYYSMKEVREMTGLTSSNLRYWEAQFKQLNPRKDGHGNRYYTLQDIDLIKQIKYIRDDLKITRIDAIKTELNSGKKKADIRQRATDILERVKSELLEIKALI